MLFKVDRVQLKITALVLLEKLNATTDDLEAALEEILPLSSFVDTDPPPPSHMMSLILVWRNVIVLELSYISYMPLSWELYPEQ